MGAKFDHRPQLQLSSIAISFFDNTQWKTLRRKYKAKQYDDEEYQSTFSILKPVLESYNAKKPYETNWLTTFKNAEDLKKQYCHALDASSSDVSFCVFFVDQRLMLMKYRPGLFKEEVDCPEGDYAIKFSGVITERFFHGSDLRLKWYDLIFHISIYAFF